MAHEQCCKEITRLESRLASLETQNAALIEKYEGRRFPVLYQSVPCNGPTSVPWSWVEKFEGQFLRNHRQTVQGLSERGGLSPMELWMVAHGREWDYLQTPVTQEQALAWLRSEPWSAALAPRAGEGETP